MDPVTLALSKKYTDDNIVAGDGIPLSTKAAANGVASLDASGWVNEPAVGDVGMRAATAGMVPAHYGKFTVSTMAWSEGAAVLTPIRNPWRHRVTAVWLEVTTAAAGGVVRVGLYAPGAGHYPGALLADVGLIDVSTTGIKSIAVSPSVVMQGGIMWVAVSWPSASADLGALQLRVEDRLNGGMVRSGTEYGGSLFWNAGRGHVRYGSAPNYATAMPDPAVHDSGASRYPVAIVLATDGTED